MHQLPTTLGNFEFRALLTSAQGVVASSFKADGGALLQRNKGFEGPPDRASSSQTWARGLELFCWPFRAPPTNRTMGPKRPLNWPGRAV